MTLTSTLPHATKSHAEECEETIVSNVRMYLSLSGLRQADLAKPLGIVPQTVSMKMTGNTSWSVPDLVKTADFLGVRVEDLLDDSLLHKAGRYQDANEKAAGEPAAYGLPQLGLNQRHSD